MDQKIFPHAVGLLTHLESVSRVTFCRQCYLPGSTCRCLESASTTSTASTTGPSWSEIADPTYGPNSASAGRGAGMALPYGSSAPVGGSIWDPPQTDFPGLPGAPAAPCQLRHPAGRAAFLERQLRAIHQGKTVPPDLPRLPLPTWDPPTTQNRRRVQLPPPPPKSDSKTDQSQQTTAPDPGPGRQETQLIGRARSRGRQPRTAQAALGRSGGTSRSEQRRAPEWNPLAKLATHRSGGWKKDLDCYMGAYFRLNYRQEPAFKWPELKAKFFQFLVEHHSEWKSIRNNDPLGYLPYMEKQFERVTGYKLVGLGTCTEWIRAGTYYHWVIAQQGQLGQCPRLAGIPPPVGPMMPPPYPPVTAALPVTAAPPVTPTLPLMAVAPIVPNPPPRGGGRPQAESQPRKRDAAATGVQGAARDTGGAGDPSSQSSGATTRESRSSRSCSKRRRRSLSRRRDPRPFVPFPLQEQDGRLQAIQSLFTEAVGHRLASEMSTLRGLRESYPDMDGEELHRFNNQVLLMIAEYHLTSACQGSNSILPVLPEGAAQLMHPLDEYLPGGTFEGCRDVRVTGRAQILRVACWLHRIDLSATYSTEVAASPRVQDYDIGPLLEYFLMPKLTDITLEEVALRVAQENRRDVEVSLRDLQEEKGTLQSGIKLLTDTWQQELGRERRKAVKKQLDAQRKELRSIQKRISRLEELLGLEHPQAQESLDVIVEETTETAVMAEEETESQATPTGGPTDDATAPVRETEQDMETEGDGGDSPVTPNEDDLLMGASVAEVETGIASLHVDSPAEPRGDDDAAT